MKNRIFAMPVAAVAMPPNPNRAATNATIKKITDQANMLIPSYVMALTGAKNVLLVRC